MRRFVRGKRGIDGSVQDCGISIPNVLEIPESCMKSSKLTPCW